jgi:hypothetical protein
VLGGQRPGIRLAELRREGEVLCPDGPLASRGSDGGRVLAARLHHGRVIAPFPYRGTVGLGVTHVLRQLGDPGAKLRLLRLAGGLLRGKHIGVQLIQGLPAGLGHHGVMLLLGILVRTGADPAPGKVLRHVHRSPIHRPLQAHGSAVGVRISLDIPGSGDLVLALAYHREGRAVPGPPHIRYPAILLFRHLSSSCPVRFGWQICCV